MEIAQKIGNNRERASNIEEGSNKTGYDVPVDYPTANKPKEGAEWGFEQKNQRLP
jgi:hypothetical protein